MDEFGAAIGGVAELRRRQRMDAPAAALARLQDRDRPARTRQLARRHQPGRAGTDDDDVLRLSDMPMPYLGIACGSFWIR